MKTIYSILSIPINAALDDKISIGLVMSNGEQYFFQNSFDKLNALKGILDNEKFYFIKSYLKALEKDINSDSESELFFKDLSTAGDWINDQYLIYLSKYSNNIIQFSYPKIIDLDFSFNNFIKLFESYIFKYNSYESDSVRHKEIDVFYKIEKSLYPAIEENVNIDITLDSSNFENLFAPIEVNFFGINNVPVAGQAFNFEKKYYNLENDVTRYISLTKAIELEGKENGKYFVLGREPQKKNEKNHLMWEHIRDSNFLEFIDIDEVGIVEDYVKSHDVKPYIVK
ncbi:hypothetical protein ACTJIV_15670 [Chryseobacterium sp. 22532]|uniref:hypothetical protein n=1 Tax=Chryseobacterium sp. 22532 TaxID=3453938 RepID=UPI003F82B7E3